LRVEVFDVQGSQHMWENKSGSLKVCKCVKGSIGCPKGRPKVHKTYRQKTMHILQVVLLQAPTPPRVRLACLASLPRS